MLVLFRSFKESRTCDDTKFPWKCITTNVGFKARFYTSKDIDEDDDEEGEEEEDDDEEEENGEEEGE